MHSTLAVCLVFRSNSLLFANVPLSEYVSPNDETEQERLIIYVAGGL